MDFLRSWILTVTACAMVVALGESLSPGGTVKKVGRLTGGLVLLLGILQPVLALDWEGLDWETMAVPAVVQETKETAREKEEELLKTIIEEELGAYVWDKAASLGASVAVQVTCVLGEDGLPYPWSAQVQGRVTASQRQAIGRMLREELEIPDQRQTFWEEGGT